MTRNAQFDEAGSSSTANANRACATPDINACPTENIAHSQGYLTEVVEDRGCVVVRWRTVSPPRRGEYRPFLFGQFPDVAPASDFAKIWLIILKAAQEFHPQTHALERECVHGCVYIHIRGTRITRFQLESIDDLLECRNTQQ